MIAIGVNDDGCREVAGAAVAAMPRAARAMESREASEAKALAVAEELEGMRPGGGPRGSSAPATPRP